MSSKRRARSQVMELFLAVADALGLSDDEAIAQLAQAGPESVENWRSGAVAEFKTKKLEAAIANLRARLSLLRALAGEAHGDEDLGLLTIERGASPVELQRDFHGRISYDYAGHRFLYFEPQGALAWENLIRTDYGQELWLAGVGDCARAWLDARLGGDGHPRGLLARALGLGRAGTPRGLDLVSLGSGEAAKEASIVEALAAAERGRGRRLAWLSLVPVDVSIPLLLTAARTLRAALGERGELPPGALLPVCADFEDGRLAFARRLRSATPAAEGGARLVAVLGNVFGNLRDEEGFVRGKLSRLSRPGDWLWLEVGLRPRRIEEDPLHHMTVAGYRETPAEANRRLLLEGPYRRMAAAIGRPPPEIELRVWLREGDESARVPGSVNFSHDLVIRDERRACTMLYSRRYQLEPLGQWLQRAGWDLEATRQIADDRGIPRVAHLLLRRRAAA